MYRSLTAVMLACAALGVQAQPVATVNDQAIPKAREDNWVRALTTQGQTDNPQLRERVKQDLIRREVLIQEATRRGLPARADLQFQVDIQRENILINAVLREELDKRPITDADVRAAYEAQKAREGSRQFQARHILVEKEDEARALIAQLRQGANFEELAKRSRDTGSAARGGDLGWATQATFVKPFTDAMVQLAKGQITPNPVQTQFGWHVIRLDDVRDFAMPPFEQVQGQLREALVRQRTAAITDELVRRAKIQ